MKNPTEKIIKATIKIPHTINDMVKLLNLFDISDMFYYIKYILNIFRNQVYLIEYIYIDLF